MTGDESGWIHVWRADSLKAAGEIELHSGRVWSIAFSPDGKRMLTASLDQTARIWDTSGGMDPKSWQLERVFRGHTNDVMSAAFLDGRSRVVTCGDWTVRVWDATRDAESRVLMGPGKMESVAFSPNGRLVAGGSEAGLAVWDVASGKRVGPVNAKGKSARAIAFSPDGSEIAAASSEVCIWPLDGSAPRSWEAAGGEIMGLAYSKKGDKLAIAYKGGPVGMWKSTTGSKLWTAAGHKSGTLAVAFSPDDHLLVSCGEDKTVRVWNVQSGEPVRTFPGHGGTVTNIAFSPDGKRLASVAIDNTTRIWNMETGIEERILKGHVHFVTGVGFTPDGKRLADAAGDRTIKLYDMRTFQESLTLKGHKDWVTGVAFSPDGSLLASSSWDGTIRLWEAPLDISVAIPPEADLAFEPGN